MPLLRRAIMGRSVDQAEDQGAVMQLLEEVIAGERAAMGRFIEEYGPGMRRTVESTLKGALRSHVDDVFQYVIERLFRPSLLLGRRAAALRKYDPERGKSLSSYLRYFTEKRTLDWVRKHRRDYLRQVELDDNLPEAANDEVPQWVGEVMERFSAECTPAEQQLFRLCFVDDRPLIEVARILGVKMSTLYQRIHRLREKLRLFRAEFLATEESRGAVLGPGESQRKNERKSQQRQDHGSEAADG